MGSSPLLWTPSQSSSILTPNPNIIQPPGRSSRWHRDPGVTEFIRHLEQYRQDPSRMSASELRDVAREIARCQASFEYAARNYFWISTKESGEKLFSLWDTQELILESIYELKAAGRPQRLLVLKSRQLGCSTLIEAIIAWRTIFFRNKNAVICSNDDAHAGKVMFAIALFIYDRLPWWLQPSYESREIYSGIKFANPDPRTKSIDPGNESRIMVHGANGKSSVGQGQPVHVAHLSEVSDYPYKKARQIIEGDLGNALVSHDPETIAVIESTGKNAGSYFHKLWNKNVELGDRADWQPRFFGWIFDRKHFVPPPQGWRPAKEEKDIRDHVLAKWVECNHCSQMRESLYRGRSTVGSMCPACRIGTLQPKELSDGQLYWWEGRRLNAGKDEESMKELLQEQAITPEDCFQVPGATIFPLGLIKLAANLSRDPAYNGFFDKQGVFHAVSTRPPRVGQCIQDWCTAQHQYDDDIVSIWELPLPGKSYYVGADVGAGLGEDKDYSVGVVNKLGPWGDVTVAKVRTNKLDPVSFASILVHLARFYNGCEIACEANKHDRCAQAITDKYQYQNVYQQRRLSHGPTGARTYHWYTSNQQDKNRLFTTFVAWLKDGGFLPASSNLVTEMRDFTVKEGTTEGFGAARGRKDDELMATMITLFCAHEGDWDSSSDRPMLPSEMRSAGEAKWDMTCSSCEFKWGAEHPEEIPRCPRCNSIRKVGRKNERGGRFSVSHPDDELEDSRIPDENMSLSIDAL